MVWLTNLEVVPEQLVFLAVLIVAAASCVIQKTDKPFYNHRCNLIARFQSFTFVLFSFATLSISVA